MEATDTVFGCRHNASVRCGSSKRALRDARGRKNKAITGTPGRVASQQKSRRSKVSWDETNRGSQQVSAAPSTPAGYWNTAPRYTGRDNVISSVNLV